MPPPIIATIASSQLFPISTGGSAYFYPKILDSNGAALGSDYNATGNGSSFGHFYKNLLSSSASFIVSNVSTNVFPGAPNVGYTDSNASVSLWTSTGKFLTIPLLGSTYTTIRKDMIAKEGAILNTVSTQNVYSTIISYQPTNPSNFIFKEGTYSTVVTQAYGGPFYYNFSFADISYLNFQKTGMTVEFSTNSGSYNGDNVTISNMDWNCNTSGYVATNTLGFYNTSTNLSVIGDVVFNMGCSNYDGFLKLNISMSNLDPANYYRMDYLSNITSISHGTLTEVTHNTIPCIQFPGTLLDYISLSTQINTYTSGSICLLADANFSGGFTCNLMYILNPGDTANAFQYDITAGPATTSYDRITLGGSISNTTTCNYDNTKWHFITTTFSNYTINYSNFFDLYYYYNSVKKGSFVSNVGHTSSLIGPTLVLGQYYPGYVAHLGVFDRCLCKREIEIYSDIMFSSTVPLNIISYLAPGTYSWTVPSGVTSITITLNGAGGGSVAGYGGKGGNVTGTYSVGASYTYTIIVGGTGTYGGTGGSSGGGTGYNGGAGGGGYTAFAYSGTNIVIVGGGGGGGTGSGNNGGDGGDSTAGASGSSGGGTAATGGSTSAGTGAVYSSANGGNGASLTGGNARTSGRSSPGGGGGGAGYYGGGGGATPAQSGAGGSSYIGSGFTASVDAQGGGSGSDIDGSVTITW